MKKCKHPMILLNARQDLNGAPRYTRGVRSGPQGLLSRVGDRPTALILQGKPSLVGLLREFLKQNTFLKFSPTSTPPHHTHRGGPSSGGGPPKRG